jgi:nicotinate-nucleotide adenylyltransferase
MKIAFFGGTFDPVHRGHMVIARMAAEKFDLGRIYFVPADIPPHKQKRALADFRHRFAMIALATADDKRFVPSLLDAPTGRPNYSIEAVRRLKKLLSKSDKLYFLIGMDAFRDIATWKRSEELLGECDFIVVARPGYSLADAGRVLPKALRPSDAVLDSFSQRTGALELPGATIHLLHGVREQVSSTEVRAAVRKPVKQLSRLVPLPVAEYIKKEHLYEVDGAQGGAGSVRYDRILSLQGMTRSPKHE